jgi:hypothetical protein
LSGEVTVRSGFPDVTARNRAYQHGSEPGNAYAQAKKRVAGRTAPKRRKAMTNTNPKVPALVGAGIGLAIFLAVALLPALLYGGYAGVLLAGGIFGTPVVASFGVRALIVFGMVLGVTAVGSLFAVAGAAAGAAVGALLRVTPAEKKAAEKA